MVELLRRYLNPLRAACIAVSVGGALALLVAATQVPTREGPLWLALLALIPAANATTLVLLGGADREERELRARLRKARLQIHLREADYLLDPKQPVSAQRDAERRQKFLDASAEA
jgi:hypothetical protein